MPYQTKRQMRTELELKDKQLEYQRDVIHDITQNLGAHNDSTSKLEKAVAGLCVEVKVLAEAVRKLELQPVQAAIREDRAINRIRMDPRLADQVDWERMGMKPPEPSTP